jgi:GT2 family glycosyltransferase
VGGARYRSAEAEGFVDTVFLGAFPRRVFETVGLYDPGAVTNEDAELNQRILAAGGRIYLSRDIVVHYHPRDTFAALGRQYFRYGRGRARTLLKHGRFPTARPLAPFLFVLSVIAVLGVPPLRPFAPLWLSIYGLVVLAEAARLSWRHGIGLFPTIALALPVMHAAHGIGFGLGLVRYSLRSDWGEPERLARRPPSAS